MINCENSEGSPEWWSHATFVHSDFPDFLDVPSNLGNHYNDSRRKPKGHWIFDVTFHSSQSEIYVYFNCFVDVKR